MARTLRSDLAAAGDRARDAWGGFPSWVAGAVTAVQAAAVTFLGVLALTLVAVAAAPTEDGSVSVDWSAAGAVGAQLWLFGFGVPVTAGGVTFTLMPIGLALLAGVVTALFARRFAAPTLGSALAAGATFGAIVAIGGAASGAGLRGALTGATWAAVAGLLGTAAGIRRSRGVWVAGPWRVPAAVRAAARLSGALTASVFALGAVTLFAWVVVGWPDIRGAAQALDPDPVGGVVLAIGELAYVPTLVAWDVAWLSGPGFSTGDGTIYAPSELDAAPLPLLPILGALPQAAGGPLVWAPLVVVGAGFAARLASTRGREGDVSFGETLLQAPATALVVGGGMALASGSAGAGHLSHVGPEPLTIGLVVAGELTAGALVADAWRRWRARARVAPTERSARAPENPSGSASARRPAGTAARRPVRRAGPAAPARARLRTPPGHSR